MVIKENNNNNRDDHLNLKCHGEELGHIKLNEDDNRYYFVEYSDEYLDGRYGLVGDPLNLCPYCGKNLSNKGSSSSISRIKKE